MSDTPSPGGPSIGPLSPSGAPNGPKRVTRTGLALVHENEVVYPAAGSAAQALSAIDATQGSVQVYFPVQIELRGAEEATSSRTSDEPSPGEMAVARAADLLDLD